MNYKKLLISIVVCQAAGLLGTPFTAAAIPTWYAGLTKPPIAPPNWIFGPVWTVLYLCMGVAFAIIWNKGLDKKEHRSAAILFGLQLFANVIWTPAFFGLRSPLLGFIVIVLLLVLLGLTIRSFYRISRPAAWILIPYLLWVSFATVLNGWILILN